jgi:hypothetical protein
VAPPCIAEASPADFKEQKERCCHIGQQSWVAATASADADIAGRIPEVVVSSIIS